MHALIEGTECCRALLHTSQLAARAALQAVVYAALARAVLRRIPVW